MTSTNIKLFEDKQVRTLWDESAEKWYFSIVDIVGILSESANPTTYWRVLKHRLLKEGNQTVTNCNGLKMMSADGKMRETDVADTEQILRIIQSIPSPKAEPFKQWLARVGSERIDEMIDPELAINRALEYYARKGYSTNWINQRLKTIEVRKELTDEWDKGGIKKGKEYAILTDEIYKGWSGMNARGYKNIKGLTTENLRDNMTNMELIFNMLAEATTKELVEKTQPKGLVQNMEIARRGGNAAGDARKRIERETGKPVITGRNAREIKKIGKK